MRAACIQLNSGVNIHENIAAADVFVREAVSGGAELIVTPEMTHLMQCNPKKLYETIYTEHEDPGVAHFARLADELDIYLIIGSLAIKTAEKRAVNRSYLFGSDGIKRAGYDKIHLFDVTISESEVYRESHVYEAGSRAVTADIGAAKVGLSICYDMRFPLLYRGYAQTGAHIITVPAAFTRPTGKAHWEILLRARAIETGCYVLAPAQGGEHADGRRTWGHSMIIDPWGHVVAHLEHDRPGFIFAELDLEKVGEARRRIPAWQHDPHYGI
ncbi:MAG: carbon-nitrogen hydrolase family protein [Hyphomonadaceae bacterium]|nr:carbon-nitrogen hydrolase family protein [Hyphomonadaceae bacterium]MBC6411478.1 carbon-nitrogen hydrolase family protein [Hyphomonadaceae bacterium]